MSKRGYVGIAWGLEKAEAKMGVVITREVKCKVKGCLYSADYWLQRWNSDIVAPLCKGHAMDRWDPRIQANIWPIAKEEERDGG